jgi:hypothetical protein
MLVSIGGGPQCLSQLAPLIVPADDLDEDHKRRARRNARRAWAACRLHGCVMHPCCTPGDAARRIASGTCAECTAEQLDAGGRCGCWRTGVACSKRAME